jgi:hypothetical protein
MKEQEHFQGLAKGQQAVDSPDSASPVQEPRQWDYRLGELVQVSGSKADKPQVGDKGPGCCIRMGEARMHCKTWMGEDGMWHIHPSLEKRLLEQRESDSSPSANTPAEEPNENEKGNDVGGDDVPAGAEDGGNAGDRQGLRPINAVGQCGNGERPAIGGQAGQNGQSGTGTGVGSGDSDKGRGGVRLSPKQESPIDYKLRPYFTRGKNAPNEQTAKTQAGMIRKQNLPSAKAMLDGFYSAHPAVTPRYPEWYQPSASAPATAASVAVTPTSRPVVSQEPYNAILNRVTNNLKIIDDGIRALQTGNQADLSGLQGVAVRGSAEPVKEKTKALVLDILARDFAIEFNQPEKGSLCKAVRASLEKAWEIAMAMKK